MKNLIIVIFVMVSCLVHAFSVEPNEWAKYQLERIEAMPDDPSPKDIALLATLGYPDPEVLKPETQIVREMAKERLRQIPDFPEKIAQSIEDERAKRKAGDHRESYELHRIYTFQTMGRIPHPGVVRVLGDYLFDWEGDQRKIPFEQRQIPAPSPNGYHAMQALGQLIEKPPVQKRGESYSYDDDEIWKLWYEQVRAGTRTFRFKGDPQDYTLAGPADRTKEPVTSRPAKPKVADTGAADAESSGSGVPWPILLAALAVCGAGVWFVLRSPRPGAG